MCGAIALVEECSYFYHVDLPEQSNKLTYFHRVTRPVHAWLQWVLGRQLALLAALCNVVCVCVCVRLCVCVIAS